MTSKELIISIFPGAIAHLTRKGFVITKNSFLVRFCESGCYRKTVEEAWDEAVLSLRFQIQALNLFNEGLNNKTNKFLTDIRNVTLLAPPVINTSCYVDEEGQTKEVKDSKFIDIDSRDW